MAVAAETLLAGCLLFLTFGILSSAAAATPMHGDEGQYIYTSHYFDYLFLQHNITRDEWSTNYWTLTQPMMTRHIIGASLWLHGDDLSQLPEAFDFDETTAQNAAEGRLPTPAQLSDVRSGMVVVACGAILGLYTLTRMFRGPLAGLVAAGLAIASPLTPPLLARAWAEAPMLFFLMWSLVITLLTARSAPKSRTCLIWGALGGIAVGLGLGAKLTITISIASVALWAAGILALRMVRLRRAGSTLTIREGLGIVRQWIVVGCVALAAFVISDPHLYWNPPLNAAHLCSDRATEMRLMRVH